MIFKITDGTTVFNEVQEPYMIIDDLGILHKIGEKEVITEHYEKMLRTYTSAGFFEEASNLMLVEVPKDQEEINKVFNISGYTKRYIPSNLTN